METVIKVSQNGWEYTGYVVITSKAPPEKINANSVEVDGVIIEFDEEIKMQ